MPQRPCCWESAGRCCGPAAWAARLLEAACAPPLGGSAISGAGEPPQGRRLCRRLPAFLPSVGSLRFDSLRRGLSCPAPRPGLPRFVELPAARIHPLGPPQVHASREGARAPHDALDSAVDQAASAEAARLERRHQVMYAGKSGSRTARAAGAAAGPAILAPLDAKPNATPPARRLAPLGGAGQVSPRAIPSFGVASPTGGGASGAASARSPTDSGAPRLPGLARGQAVPAGALSGGLVPPLGMPASELAPRSAQAQSSRLPPVSSHAAASDFATPWDASAKAGAAAPPADGAVQAQAAPPRLGVPLATEAAVAWAGPPAARHLAPLDPAKVSLASARPEGPDTARVDTAGIPATASASGVGPSVQSLAARANAVPPLAAGASKSPRANAVIAVGPAAAAGVAPSTRSALGGAIPQAHQLAPLPSPLTRDATSKTGVRHVVAGSQGGRRLLPMSGAGDLRPSVSPPTSAVSSTMASGAAGSIREPQLGAPGGYPGYTGVPACTPAQVIRFHKDLVSDYEVGEILEFKAVYFAGNGRVSKTRASNRRSNNHGFDDARGEYQVREGDHILYRYEVTGRLGAGSFGQVVRCLDHKTGESVAIKVVRNRKRFHKQARVEVALLERIRAADTDGTACVIHLRQSFVFRAHMCIVFPILSLNLYELSELPGRCPRPRARLVYPLPSPLNPRSPGHRAPRRSPRRSPRRARLRAPLCAPLLRALLRAPLQRAPLRALSAPFPTVPSLAAPQSSSTASAASACPPSASSRCSCCAAWPCWTGRSWSTATSSPRTCCSSRRAAPPCE